MLFMSMDSRRWDTSPCFQTLFSCSATTWECYLNDLLHFLHVWVEFYFLCWLVCKANKPGWYLRLFDNSFRKTENSSTIVDVCFGLLPHVLPCNLCLLVFLFCSTSLKPFFDSWCFVLFFSGCWCTGKPAWARGRTPRQRALQRSPRRTHEVWERLWLWERQRPIQQGGDWQGVSEQAEVERYLLLWPNPVCNYIFSHVSGSGW